MKARSSVGRVLFHDLLVQPDVHCYKIANSIVLDGTVFRLDGIDAPELDQICIDESGETWLCGKRKARNRLATLIGDSVVYCDIKAVGPGSPRDLRRRSPTSRLAPSLMCNEQL